VTKTPAPSRPTAHNPTKSGTQVEPSGGRNAPPQADGERQRQEARDDEVGALHPTVVAEGQRADRVTQRVVVGAGGTLKEEHQDEQRTGDRAAGEKGFRHH
jgi:hypothetical protein